MAICARCGRESWSTTRHKGASYCNSCYDIIKHEEILEASKSVHKAEDPKGWDHGDMSDLFWYHLGEYVKDKNPEEHFPIMRSCLYWAFHDSHGLSSSFIHALNWAKVDYKEVLDWSC